MITETDDVSRAIDEAAYRWPEARGSRGRLLLLLVDAGYHTIREERRRETERRRAAIVETSGSLPGVYEEGYLERLRSEWPE
jgi:hypothetical protein